MSSAAQFELADPPADAVSAVRFGAKTNHLLVSSWDRKVYLYDTEVSPRGALLRSFTHNAPVLDACFGESDAEAFSAGLDYNVKRLDLETGQESVLTTHKAGVRSILYNHEKSNIISASWDCSLRLIDPRSPSFTSIELPHKPFSMSQSPTKLVVAMASRVLHIYDIRSLSSNSEPWQRRESSLKFMTRAVACMPNDAGFASSSIEGRVAVEFFDPSEETQSRKYAFKCHRQVVDNVDVVYPVNALAFHPGYGTFASGGGDGVIALWDGDTKRRIRQYPKYSHSVAALAFNSDGSKLAAASCPGFEDGKDLDEPNETKVYIRSLVEGEAKSKGK